VTGENSRRPLKILHVDPEKQWGGGESQVLGLIRYLSRQCHQNHLLAHPNGPLAGLAQQEGISTFPLRMLNEIDLRAIFSIRRLIRRERYDIIHFHTKRAHALSLWVGPSAFFSKRVVTRRMDYPIRKNWYNTLLYNQQVDGVVAISHKIAEILVGAGVEKTRVRVIHSGIDPIPFQSLPEREENDTSLIIGSAAVLEERKGLKFLLQAVANLRRRGCTIKLYLAGDGSQKRNLQILSQELGLQDSAVFLGFVSDIPQFLSQIDIFVLPSLNEGLGVAVLEAMASGRPVIATRVGGLPELVEDRVTGYLVPPGNPAALADAIVQLASQRILLREMGSKGKMRLERHFTLEKMAQRNEEFYYDLQSRFSHQIPSEELRSADA